MVSAAGGSGLGISASFFAPTTLSGREPTVLLRDDIGEAEPEGSAGGDVGLIDSNAAHPSPASWGKGIVAFGGFEETSASNALQLSERGWHAD